MPINTLTGSRTFVSKHPLDLTKCTKREVEEYFENAYDLYESIYSTLNDESAIFMVPDRLRRPLIFYYAHTAVVYVNKLLLVDLIQERVNFEYEKLFEAGVNEYAWDSTASARLDGARLTWPKLEQVREYRRQVRSLVLGVIQEQPLSLPITPDSKWWAVMMGIEHERVHFETSSVLIRHLPVTMVTRPDEWKYAPIKTGVSGINMIKVDRAEVTLGKPRNFPTFGWDNEYGETKRIVPAFEASACLVSNDEFLKFVQDGGYNRRQYWTDEGWRWRQERALSHPQFWVCDCGCKSGCGGELHSYSHCRRNGDEILGVSEYGPTTYRYRAMFDNIDMPWAWPVDVNYHEARAYCKWKGQDFRLISEAEHNVIRGQQVSRDTGSDPIFDKPSQRFNFNLIHASSAAVDAYPANELGFYDVCGNVWQWTEDHYNGLCEDTDPLYADYSITSYDGKHNILLCGSWASSGTYASRFCRNGFRRHFLQHSGFRLAKSISDGNKDKVQLPVVVIETEVFELGSGEAVNEDRCHLDLSLVEPMFVSSKNNQFRFETQQALNDIIIKEFGVHRSFPVALADFCTNLVRTQHLLGRTALWLGIGAGSGPLGISAIFQKVLAIDVSARFVDAALRLKKGEKLSAGNHTIASLKSSWQPENVTFKQFSWIPLEVGRNSDLTVVTLLDRLQDPTAWLLRLEEVTHPDGRVVIVTPRTPHTASQVTYVMTRKRMCCVTEAEVVFDTIDGETSQPITVWQHVK